MRHHSGTKGTSDGYGGSAIEPHSEVGGKRHGRTMRKRNYRRAYGFVTLENLQAARDNNGVYDHKLRCVIYNRKGE